jgi:hypothetical protein
MSGIIEAVQALPSPQFANGSAAAGAHSSPASLNLRRARMMK